MSKNEKDLSHYIDRLNADKKPKECVCPENSREMEKLFDTIKLVRSLKEPKLPNSDYPKKLAQNVADRLLQKKPVKNAKKMWLISVAAAAVVIAIVGMLNFIAPFNKENIVYAMEKAFQGVKSYHGILEVIEINSQGKAATQAKLEVWADKQGRYFVKELQGSQEGLITVNNGQKKWQLRPDEKQALIFSAFPDSYRFTFELGKEVEKVKNSLKSNLVGEETVSGRKASILEVSPQGGVSYRLWIDEETKLPLQKQSEIQNAWQYRVTFTEIDFIDAIPEQLITYSLPAGFKETDTNPEQIVTDLAEAQGMIGFAPRAPGIIPAGYSNDSISVETATKIVKMDFVTQDKAKRIVVLESNSVSEFKPATTAVLGKVGDSAAEVQSPMMESLGILGGSGPYAGVTDISSIRWQQDSLEYAVVGNVPLEEMVKFIETLKLGKVQIPSDEAGLQVKPQIEVPFDLKIEESDQKSVDGGHSPWRLDPAFVAQVFASLKISPEGINGDYPIKSEDLKITENNGKDVIMEVSGDKTLIRRIYLKRLIRQDSTGIWTVVGYDPVDKK